MSGFHNKAFKGDNSIIGGSYKFTGAPFYSAISAFKAGVDLAHIFCLKSSSVSIKSYSP
jgi:ATP-dependent NAD(P)H-hydrate dehydratase